MSDNIIGPFRFHHVHETAQLFLSDPNLSSTGTIQLYNALGLTQYNALCKKVLYSDTGPYGFFDGMLKEWITTCGQNGGEATFENLRKKLKELGFNFIHGQTDAWRRILTMRIPVDSSNTSTFLENQVANTTVQIPPNNQELPSHPPLDLENIDELDGPINFPPLQKAVQFNNGKNVDCYKMNSNPRGLVLLINIMNFWKNGREIQKDYRQGSEVDFKNMLKFWKDFGYEVFKGGFTNLKKTCIENPAEELSNVLKAFRAEVLKANVDSSVIVIMTHGSGKKGHILLSDYGEVDLDKIINKFNNINFKDFAGKPKLFYIQACRNEKGEDKPDVLPEHLIDMSDVYVFHSTVPLALAYRNEAIGSAFINSIISTYNEFAHDTPILGLQTKVNNKMMEYFRGKSYKQMSNGGDLGLLNEVYFNPGL